MARRLTILARGVLLIGVLFLLNAVLWIISAVVFSVFQRRSHNQAKETTSEAQELLNQNSDDVQKRSGTLLSFALVAWATGLRHALDADHISAIDNATRRIMAVPRRNGPGYSRPVTVGLFFSLGHSTIVVAVLIAIAISFTVYSRMGTFSDVGGIIGASVSGAFLFVIGVINSVILVRTIHAMRKSRAMRDKNPMNNASSQVQDEQLASDSNPLEINAQTHSSNPSPNGQDLGEISAECPEDIETQQSTLNHTSWKVSLSKDRQQADSHIETREGERTLESAQLPDAPIHHNHIAEGASDKEVISGQSLDNQYKPAKPIAGHFEFRGIFTRLASPLLRAIDRPWKMYPIGILFGLGFDTASTISLLAIAVIASSSLSGSSEANGSVVLLALLFTAGMTLADTCDAVLMICAYAWAELQAQKKWYAVYEKVPEENSDEDQDLALRGEINGGQVPDMAHEIAISTTPFTLLLTVLSIVIAFTVSIIELLGLIGSECTQCTEAADRQSESQNGGLAGRWWLWWRWCNDNFQWIGIGITAAFFLTVGVALAATIWITTRRRKHRAIYST
ncbi:hypothetical protein MYAM1_000397 [Malassezia yamatoensis]|uniref:Nickel/cobalt efflux system n=1 Tax=Malassezia yamatoensis TaxID=253288 RepID=A0AAJ6CGH4_9BASI|nr:hypothetical protein MYAM1_000397 [Malassezia yamatoensis]